MRICSFFAAALAAAVAISSAAVPAQADSYPDPWTQITNAQFPIAADGQPTYMTNGWGRYYTGPNGLEIRFTSEGTGVVIATVLSLSTAGAGLAVIGTATGAADLMAAAVSSTKLKAAIGAAGVVLGPSIGQTINDLATQGKCLGVTVPPGGISDLLIRANNAIGVVAGDPVSVLQTALSFTGPHDNEVRVWFESCNTPRAGLGDTTVPVTFPGISGVLAAQPLAPGSTPAQMFTRGDSSIFAKSSVGAGGWTQEVDPGNATAIASGGGTQMFLRGDSAVFAKSSIGNGGWVQETNPGTANQIAVSSTDVQMIRTGDNAIWAKNTIGDGGWVQQVGPGNATAIAVGGNTEMFIRGDAAVFAKTFSSSSWTQETFPGNASAIAVSSTGVQMFIRGDAAVFATNTIGGAWIQETSPGNASAIAVGGNTQMFIRGDAAVFATNSLGGAWTQETTPGNASKIAAGSNGTQMFIRGDSAVFATNSIGGSWIQETDPGNAVAITAG